MGSRTLSGSLLSPLTAGVLRCTAQGPSQTLTSDLGDPQLPPLLCELPFPDRAHSVDFEPKKKNPDGVIFGLIARLEEEPFLQRGEDGWRDLRCLPLFGPR